MMNRAAAMTRRVGFSATLTRSVARRTLAAESRAVPASRNLEHTRKLVTRVLQVGGVGVAFLSYTGSGSSSNPARAEGILDTIKGIFSDDKPAADAKTAEPEEKAAGEEEEEEEEGVQGPDLEDLPLISLEDVRKHMSEDSLWVTYEGVVYDVTSFVEHHPGGKELLLTAAGMDLKHFFETYTVHLQGDKAKPRGYLNGLAIGVLSAEDAATAEKEATPTKHIENRLSVMGRARKWMVVVMASLPVWMGIRWTIQVVGYVVPSLGHWLAGLLPVSVPGFGGAAQIPPVNPETGKPMRVAVIGGGIAGSGCTYTLSKSGYDVTLFEARKTLCGNAKQWEWDVNGRTATSCVSVTAWPAILYKNYVQLLKQIEVETVEMPLSWFLVSKVPGKEGFLWAADPAAPEGSLRQTYAEDFRRYDYVQRFVHHVTNFYTLNWFGSEVSMYAPQTKFGIFNPLNVIPLHTICRMVGISQEWWDIVFTPHYTASFLSDKLDNMCAVTAPLIEVNIPLNPTPENSKDRVLTTCETWADAGSGIREVFRKLTAKATVHTDTRVLDVKINDDGTKTVYDEHGRSTVVDRVVFACQVSAIGNIHKSHNWIEDTMFSVPEYADDWHPGTGHMHAVMHRDGAICPEEFREDWLQNGSNYVEVSQNADGKLNIENTYNFGVQSPGIKWLQDIPATEREPMLISHAITEGKVIDPEKVVGVGNHARAHPLYSGWNIMTMLSLRLSQGRQGVYYCCNWTTPGNTHDMSLLSGICAAHAIGAEYPFDDPEATKDFGRLRGLMGL